MSKDLQSEYKNMVISDTPDLWARIESALPAKTGAGNVVNMPAAARTESKSRAKKTRKLLTFAIPTVVAAAVALICVLPQMNNSEIKERSKIHSVKEENGSRTDTKNKESAREQSKDYSGEAAMMAEDDCAQEMYENTDSMDCYEADAMGENLNIKGGEATISADENARATFGTDNTAAAGLEDIEKDETPIYEEAINAESPSIFVIFDIIRMLLLEFHL